MAIDGAPNMASPRTGTSVIGKVLRAVSATKEPRSGGDRWIFSPSSKTRYEPWQLAFCFPIFRGVEHDLQPIKKDREYQSRQ